MDTAHSICKDWGPEAFFPHTHDAHGELQLPKVWLECQKHIPISIPVHPRSPEVTSARLGEIFQL